MLLPPLRGPDDGEGADEMCEAARGDVAESFAAATENRAMRVSCALARVAC
jgi:hypothetical protein